MSYHHIFFTNVLNTAAEKKMTHQELAAKAKLSASLLSSITRGQGNPTLETMTSIAAALETPLPYLLTHHALNADYLAMLSKDRQYMPILPDNYECVTVILPRYRAFTVKKWGAEAIKELKRKK